jgi:hypothetical protein
MNDCERESQNPFVNWSAVTLLKLYASVTAPALAPVTCSYFRRR